MGKFAAFKMGVMIFPENKIGEVASTPGSVGPIPAPLHPFLRPSLRRQYRYVRLLRQPNRRQPLRPGFRSGRREFAAGDAGRIQRRNTRWRPRFPAALQIAPAPIRLASEMTSPNSNKLSSSRTS